MTERPPLADRTLPLLGLAAILIVALVLRLSHFETLLPWFYFEDELRTVRVALHLLQNHTIDPAYNYYPAFSFYVNALAYFLWALPGHAHLIPSRGLGVVGDYFLGRHETDLDLILLSRWVSLFFGMAAVAASYWLFRLYLEVRWALLGTLIMALNPVWISLSVLGKNDTITCFFFIIVFCACVLYLRRGQPRWIVLASLAAGPFLMCKNNWQATACVIIVMLLRGLKEERGLVRMIAWRDAWIAGLAITASTFIASPYSIIRLHETMVNAGGIYFQSEIISTYHTDTLVWWRERYYYVLSIVLPFVFGLPLFAAAAGGVVHHARRHFFEEPLLLINLVGLLYVFASQSGGPRGGAFPYYLFAYVVPLGVVAALVWLSDLAASSRMRIRIAGTVLAAGVMVWSLAGVDTHWKMFFSGYDRLGPWLEERVGPGRRVMLVSVYYPSPALGLPRAKSVWPQEFPARLEADAPDVIVFDTWLVAGFRKLYHDQPVAPLVDEIIAGGRGYKAIKKFPIDYLGRSWFVRLDPEHDVELIVVSRE